jgi:hypothetical protein
LPAEEIATASPGKKARPTTRGAQCRVRARRNARLYHRQHHRQHFCLNAADRRAATVAHAADRAPMACQDAAGATGSAKKMAARPLAQPLRKLNPPASLSRQAGHWQRRKPPLTVDDEKLPQIPPQPSDGENGPHRLWYRNRS